MKLLKASLSFSLKYTPASYKSLVIKLNTSNQSDYSLNQYQDRQCTCNVTWRSVRVTTFDMESLQYYCCHGN